jgi:hypothetical protein
MEAVRLLGHVENMPSDKIDPTSWIRLIVIKAWEGPRTLSYLVLRVVE